MASILDLAKTEGMLFKFTHFPPLTRCIQAPGWPILPAGHYNSDASIL